MTVPVPFLHANPAALANDDLADAVSELAAHIHTATYRLLVLIAELDRRGVWADQGAKTCAHWLSWGCGIDPHTAREKIRVAHALESLPQIATALERGELGYSKARALTRIATPDNEIEVLNIGLQGTAGQVERYVRAFRRAVSSEESALANRQHAERAVRWCHDEYGAMIIECRRPPESGAKVVKALDLAIDAHEAEQPSASTPELDYESYPRDVPREPRRALPRNARRADALVWLADRLLESGGKVPVLASEPHEIVVHVDAQVLTDASAGRCEVEDGGAMAGETARRLACDASVVPIVDGADGEPLSVGRRTRSIPPAIRRALAARDAGCRFPGCNSGHRLHGHHVRHWANGGETRLDNLVLLCPYHHRLVHEGGFDVERLDDGAFRFLRPDGRAVAPPALGAEASALAIVEWNRRRGMKIDDATAAAKDNGWGFSLDLAVFGVSAVAPAPMPRATPERARYSPRSSETSSRRSPDSRS